MVKVVSPIDDTPAYKAGMKPGDLIIFPSTINHWVEPNPSKDDRISLAFNWSVE